MPRIRFLSRDGRGSVRRSPAVARVSDTRALQLVRAGRAEYVDEPSTRLEAAVMRPSEMAVVPRPLRRVGR